VSQQPKESRCLGLIGGLGPGATVFYYRELISAIERQGRTPRLLVAHADVGRVYAYVTAKDFDALARYLVAFVKEMAAGGAELTAIVAATPHICAPQFTAISPLPLIDMLDEVAAVLRARGLKRIALLGTRFTIETRMFGRLGDVEIVMPATGEIERIHELYTDVMAGRVSNETIAELRKLARKFVTQERAQAVLIAGTDLSPVLAAGQLDLPTIDCARVHIDAIARQMIS
jgi:aspartate racemase